jgi:F-type H+-transporting ATPase subunit gamma
MIRPQAIAEELAGIQTIGHLTEVFKSIASIQIARIKRQVETSQGFFEALWRLYTAIRVDVGEGSEIESRVTTDRHLFVAITAEGGFSGDIDEKLISWMLSQYDPRTTDIICIGHHGAVRLAQAGVEVVQYFKLPSDKQRVNVGEMIDLIERYPETTAYYQNYVSLAVQDVKRISLQTAVKQLSGDLKADEVITSHNYIFEPSADEVIGYLESTMLGVALSQIILESKLAQYASRFRAMSAAHDTATEKRDELRLLYRRARRAVSDERLKEIAAGLAKTRLATEAGS